MHLGKCVGVGMVAALALATLSPLSRSDESSSTGNVSWMGVSVRPLSDGLREQWDYRGAGVMVTAVAPESPAELAGIVRGDVLVVVGSASLRSPSDFEQAQARITPGGAVSVAIARSKGRIIDIVKVHYDETPTPATADSPQESGQPAVTSETAVTSTEAAPVPVPSQTAPAPAGAPTMPTLGVQCETLGADLAAALDVSMDHGVVVLAVTKDGPAELAGIRGGDVISKVGGKAVGNTAELEKALATSSGSSWIRIHRHGTEKEVEVRLAAVPSVDDRVERDASAREIERLRETVRALEVEVRRLQTEMDALRSDSQ